MNENVFKHIIEKKEKRKICANHPISVWKEGYKRCYWGFKLRENCEPLEQSEEIEREISKSTTNHPRFAYFFQGFENFNVLNFKHLGDPVDLWES